MANQKPKVYELPASASIYERHRVVKRKEEEKIPMNIEISDVFGI